MRNLIERGVREAKKFRFSSAERAKVQERRRLAREYYNAIIQAIIDDHKTPPDASEFKAFEEFILSLSDQEWEDFKAKSLSSKDVAFCNWNEARAIAKFGNRK